jgi:hypothetical protein
MKVISHTEERLILLEKTFQDLADDRFMSLKQFQKLIKTRNVSTERI